MAGTEGATGTQADPGTQPPAGDAEALAADAGEQGTQPESISLEEARKLRSESSNLRKRLKDLEDEKARAEVAQLSEHEKAIAEARTEEAAKWAGYVRRASLVTALGSAGCIDPALAAVAPEFDALEVKDGKVIDPEPAIAAFRKSHPSMFGTRGSADGGARGDATPAIGLNELLRAAARR